MQVTVNMPEDFSQDLKTQILKMAEDAFTTVKSREQYPNFLKIDEAASYLNVSRSTLMNKFVKQMGLKCLMFDSLTMFSKADCNEFMKQHQI